MNILVSGIGNIGTTLLNLLCDYQDLLEVRNIYALKNTALTLWNQVDLEKLTSRGVIVCTNGKCEGLMDVNAISHTIHYVFDCNANGYGSKNKKWYQSLSGLKACSAQGSEKGFGLPYMLGVNDNIIVNKKYAQVVSCNTHSLGAVLMALGGRRLDNLQTADFVVVRRSEDIGNHQRLVSANVVARHLDGEIGTHHAIDVKDLFETLGQVVDIQSSDITTPSQLMHAVRFNLHLKSPRAASELEDAITQNSLISVSNKFDSNVIFELGRRYSSYGRLFSHAIIVSNNLLFNRCSVKGWAFIPQEGNTILSTISAFLLQTGCVDVEQKMETIKKELIQKEW